MLLVRISIMVFIGLMSASCGEDCRKIAVLDFEVPPLAAYPSDPLPGRTSFAVFGDTQRTSWQECLIGREVNDAETATLIQAVADAGPAFVVIVGDLVFHGADPGHWQFFDHIATPLRDQNIPILPTAGNHEYWGNNERALVNMRARFPRFATDTWYSQRHGDLALIILDTNEGELEESTWQRQADWYEETIQMFDEDPDVRGILVFGHHPPFTNSPIVDGDEHVREVFLPSFCESAKALAFITGHAHGYEHFIRGAEESCGDRAHHFIISAGGGGPRPDELRSAEDTGLTDSFVSAAPRPFNYLWLEPQADGVSIEVRGFQRGETELGLLEAYSLDY